MKKYLKNIVLAVLIVCALCVLSSCAPGAEDAPESFIITYSATEGGSIAGESYQTIEIGGDGTAVIATPDDGYEFSHWSDGEENLTRQDTDIQSNQNLIAIFVKMEGNVVLKLTYLAGEGGRINGETVQNVPYGQNGMTVTATPEDGYTFYKWSDNVIVAKRTDLKIKTGFTVRAIFNKTEQPALMQVKYVAGIGGRIEGEDEQEVVYGKDATMVRAAEDEGYKFVKWSDGKTTSSRTDLSVKYSFTVTAVFERLSVTANYSASEGGTIEGITEQTMFYGGNADTVSVSANHGYEFVGWSDTGNTNLDRQDSNIKTNIDAVAIFEEINKVFAYDYNRATDNNEEKAVKIKYFSLPETTAVIPEREYYEFGGWYLDAGFETLIFDENGNFLLGYEILDEVSESIYAKWTITITDPPTYKILMVFVTEIKATLSLDNNISGKKAKVDYKMTEKERQFCELIPTVIENTLNETFDGLVIFDVDYYFTTAVVDESSFLYGYGTNGQRKDFYIMADGIPEVGYLLKDYRSILTTICLNDYDKILRGNAAGRGGEKYASIYLESLRFELENYTIDEFCDFANSLWKHPIYLYLHEFTHTVEDAAKTDYYHNILDDFKHEDSLKITKLYLLKQIKKDSENRGIPYSFWRGEFDVYVQYFVDSNSLMGGRINGKAAIHIYVPFGGTAEEITAVPNNGYIFVRWSDGITTATRQDTNIISYARIYAYFERIT